MAAVEIGNFIVLPSLNAKISARQHAEEFLKMDPSGEGVAVYQLPRAAEYGMKYYLNSNLPEWVPGTSEPQWIIAGRLPPDVRFFDIYEIRMDESRFFFVYHHK